MLKMKIFTSPKNEITFLVIMINLRFLEIKILCMFGCLRYFRYPRKMKSKLVSSTKDQNSEAR